MGPTYRALPVGMRFRPSDLELAVYFLIKKALGLPMNARTVPEECNDIFSTHPRDLPGENTFSDPFDKTDLIEFLSFLI